MEDTAEQLKNNNNDRPWLFKPGQSGNPSGRPKGAISLKEYAKKMLHDMTEEERMEFMKGMDKKTIWEMAEGKAKQDIDAKVDANLTVNVVKYGADTATPQV